MSSNTTDQVEASGDGATTTSSDHEANVALLNIVTYVGSAIAIVGIMLTLLSYIGYRKFHIKRPHIIMVNLCVCLLIYYFSYLISNASRQNSFADSGFAMNHHLCLFGAIVCNFSSLAAWFWILAYWIILLVMFRRPMGGHVSHFFIKAATPAYGIPFLIMCISAIIAYTNGDITRSFKHDEKNKEKGYFNSQCFVGNVYVYVGAILPVCLAFIPMLVIFILIMRGVICTKEERLKSSNNYRNVRSHLKRLTFITVLLIIVALSSVFDPALYDFDNLFVSVIIFTVASSVLGVALMILFCIHQEEIRSHWLAVIRGQGDSMRKHSVAHRGSYEHGSQSSTRKSSTLMGNHPSVYIEPLDDERKSSTYRIVAKQDTDMSTLGLIEIPGTPSPNRQNDMTDDGASAKSNGVRRSKSDAATKTKRVNSKSNNDEEMEPLTPGKNDVGFEELKDNSGSNTGSKSRKKKSRSTSTPPSSPRKQKAKRQQSMDDVPKSPNNTNGRSHTSEKKRPKRSNSSNRMVTRFMRKSTSTMEDTVQLTDF